MTDAPLEPQLDESEPEPPLPQDPLLLLQDLDLSIDRLETRRQELEGGGEVGEARRHVEDLEEQVGTLKLALDSIGLEQNRFEHEVETYTQRIDAEQTRMYDGSVANPKELLSIRAEIDNLKSRRSRTEDELLGQMERREEIESRLNPLETELLEAGDRLGELRGSAAAELEDIRAALESRGQERAAAAAAIEEELLELYQELRAQKKGVGAAAVVAKVCMACHQELSPLEYEQVKNASGIRRCPNCRRILIFA
jgi:predicted  nucleic acid-binding Zn-ribbon protein